MMATPDVTVAESRAFLAQTIWKASISRDKAAIWFQFAANNHTLPQPAVTAT